MSRFLLPWFLFPVLTASVLAAESPTPADKAWVSLEQTLNSGGGHDGPSGSPADQFVGIFSHVTDYLRQADAFIREYPGDPRRWEAYLNMKDFYGASLNMLGKQDAATKAKVDAVVSPAKRETWSRRLDELGREFAAATDVSPATRYRSDIAPWFDRMFELMKKGLAEDSPEWADFRTGLDRLAAKYPDLAQTTELVKHYTAARFPAGKDTPVRRAELESLAESPNRFVQAAAREQIHFLDLAREPLDIAFTAADGRAVDLRKLRGKVILIDFWATWCVPCIEEIPNVQKAYERFHDQGFEVIGISLENAHLAPKDGVAQTEEKLDAARRHMLAFTKEKGMPWPQYFDGKWWKNDIARRYAVTAIPAMFLLDKSGRLVSTDARGPRLEQEVRRLLKE